MTLFHPHRRIVNYNMQKPMSSYLVALAIGKYDKKIEISKSGIPIELYYYPEDSAKVEPTYRYTKQMFDFLEEEIGFGYPWQNYKQVPVHDFLYSGMENTSLTIFSDAYVVDGISGILALSNTMTQDIEFNQGWNLISTYIIPDYPNISDVFEPIVNNLYLAKDEFGNVFWPEWALNNIGDNTPGKAYKIKMTADDTLQVRGAVANPLDYPLVLPDGWSFLGYLLSQNEDPSVILESIEDDLVLIKDAIGNIYFPEYDVNTMGDMIPGQGYQVRMIAEREFIYPLND